MRILYCRVFSMIMAIFVLSMPVAAQDVVRPAPEIATGINSNKVAIGEEFMIVTANPHATKAGYEILKRGGTAADAAVAAQLVLGLVEPQSSGLGGGAFVLYYDAKSKELRSYDGRETAPGLAGPYLFMENGQPLAFMDAVLGGRSVGVPGTPMLLSNLHEAHGQLTWMELFEDAIRLAEEGFEISPRLAQMIVHSADDLAKFPETKAYFLDQEGARLVNPAYAKTLKDFAFYNAPYFYEGAMAARIIAQVQNVEDNPGLLNFHDFQAYEVKTREPVCGPYRIYIVCSMGEPSSGGLTLLQILGLLDGLDMAGPENPLAWHWLTEASRLAFADRGRYMADPDFVNTPGESLLDPNYIHARRELLAADRMIEVEPGIPPDWNGPLYPLDESGDRPGTSHISIIDAYGNVLSMTTTIEGAFGSHVMVDGFLLNNELTDFSFVPADEAGNPIANRVEGGKRPRSSMAPTIVFDQSGDPVLVLGSAGGSNIIGYVLQRIVALLDWGMSVEDALAMPNVLAKWDSMNVEQGMEMEFISDKVEYKDMNSGLTAIHIKDGRYHGAADPRREGIGMGY